MNGNCGEYRRCTYVVDAYVPSISVGSTDERPVVITISDARSGVDWSTLEFYEDGVLMCSGTDCTSDPYNLSTETGKMMYEPDAGGVDVEIRVNDMTGCNLAFKTFKVGYTSEDVLVFINPHNYPNPFDPGSANSGTWIVPGLSKDCYVTMKIYDFAGELVAELQNQQWTDTDDEIYWDGTTEGGTEVANGTYLCYIYASCDGSTKTAVVKITVLRENE
jgi:hypothetical protein